MLCVQCLSSREKSPFQQLEGWRLSWEPWAAGLCSPAPMNGAAGRVPAPEACLPGSQERHCAGARLSLAARDIWMCPNTAAALPGL